MSYTLNLHRIEALSVRSFVCRSVSQSVSWSFGCSPAGPSTGYALYRGFISALFCLYVCLSVYLSVCQSVSWSVGPSVGPLVGSPTGSSTRWMYRCLPVRLVSIQVSLEMALSYFVTVEKKHTV